jgi:hypothetical protein
MGARIKDSCREIFKILGILPLTALHIYSITVFVVNNRQYFMENSKLYDIETRKNKTYFCHNQIYLFIIGVHFMLASRYTTVFLFK